MSEYITLSGWVAISLLDIAFGGRAAIETTNKEPIVL
jgi:hypothetical protein